MALYKFRIIIIIIIIIIRRGYCVVIAACGLVWNATKSVAQLLC